MGIFQPHGRHSHCHGMHLIGNTMILELKNKTWRSSFPKSQEQELIETIENGKLIFLPSLGFELFAEETKFLTSHVVNPKSKNISFDPISQTLRGAKCTEEEKPPLQNMMTRFALQSQSLIHSLFPHYKKGLQWGKTSFRPVETRGRRVSSYRKDDTRLHVDSFNSQPVQGRRLLRVFSNINPQGKPRVWKLGEPFENVVQKFLPQLSHRPWISPRLLQKLGITKGYRTLYDHIMLGLHNAMKADLEYQKIAPSLEMAFPSQSTWVVMTDKTSHAALSGQFLLEQTFFLPVQSMKSPEASPLRILEKILRKQLV
jgi:hypothetical protein